SENRLTDASFDLEQAPIAPGDGYFLGEYQGLSALGSHFGAFWMMPHVNGDGTIDQGSIFYRDPLDAESGAQPVNELPGQAMTDSSRDILTIAPPRATGRNAQFTRRGDSGFLLNPVAGEF